MYVTETSVMFLWGTKALLSGLTTVLLCDHVHSTFTVPVLTISGGSDNHTSILRLLVSGCDQNVVTYYQCLVCTVYCTHTHSHCISLVDPLCNCTHTHTHTFIIRCTQLSFHVFTKMSTSDVQPNLTHRILSTC